MESLFSAFGVLIKTIVFAALAILMLMLGFACYLISIICFILDIIVFLLSIGRAKAELSTAFVRAGNSFITGIPKLADEFYS